MSDELLKKEIITGIIRFGLIALTSYLTVKYLVQIIDPTNKQKKNAKEKADRTLKQIGMHEFKNVLSDYEMTIASQLVIPEHIEVSWKDIAGLDDVIEELKATVILPMKYPHISSSSKLHEPPKGVLLYGPPGVGKTMVAKATAKEAGARFINLDVSSLTDKWYGESQKLASAVFTLAVKIQPCIIFIDEIDSFLRKRETSDHEATSMMKAQFMILWDGLISKNNCAVIVMGATNRPNDVDSAIRRRMPAMFPINLPNLEQRIKILELILSSERVSDNVNLYDLASKCDGFSGSDLKELCRLSAMARVKEISNQAPETLFNDSNVNNFIDNIRPIKSEDFYEALNKIKRSKHINVIDVLQSGAKINDFPLN